MGFRFSLKWLLVGTVYVALAAAAFAQGQWGYADLLWAATFLAVAYAVTAAIVARGRRQAAAAGFSVAAALLVLCVQFAPETLATARLVGALGPVAPQQSSPMALSAILPATPSAGYQIPMQWAQPQTSYRVWFNGGGGNLGGGSFSGGSGMGGGGTITTATISNPSALADELAKYEVRVRAANIVATMLAGLVGAFLGAAVKLTESSPAAVVGLMAARV